MSLEVQNKGISGPIKGHVSTNLINSYQRESKRIDVIDHTHRSLVQTMTKGVGDCRDTTFEVHSKS